jgi:hypothetical protein
MTYRRGWWLVVIIVWIAIWAIYLLPEWSMQSGQPTWINVAGVYAVSKQEGSGSGRRGYPFVVDKWIDDDGKIRITQDAGRSLTFEYQMKGGYGQRESVFAVGGQDGRCQWVDNTFAYFKKSISVFGILPGLTIQVCQSKVTKHEDGMITITCCESERGLVLFLIPFSERFRSLLVLRPLGAD